MVFVIIEGQCRIEAALANGVDNTDLGMISSGELIGEVTFTFGLVSSVRIIAESDVVLISLTREAVEAALIADLDFSVAFYKLLASTCCARMRKLDIESEGDLEDIQPPVVPIHSLSQAVVIPLSSIQSFRETVSTGTSPVKRKIPIVTASKSSLDDSDSEENVEPSSSPSTQLLARTAPSGGWVRARSPCTTRRQVMTLT